MHQIDTDTAVAVRPAPAAAGDPGWFTGGNPGPGTPVPATNFSADWCNSVQGELLSILTAAGIAPDKTQINQVLTAFQKLGRIKLTANTNFYVRADGNDANTGLANAAGGAWLTVQHALSALQQIYDLGGYTATINVGAGNFAGGSVVGVVPGQTSPIIVNGNGIGSTIFNTGFGANSGLLRLRNFDVGVAALNAISAAQGATVFAGNIKLTGAPANFALLNTQVGGVLQIEGPLTVSAGAGYLVSADAGVIFGDAQTITLTGTPAFSNSTVLSSDGGQVLLTNMVFSGAATGVRYVANRNGNINTLGGGATYFPGNSSGSTASGGQYN
jgi:hypothetical protein